MLKKCASLKLHFPQRSDSRKGDHLAQHALTIGDLP